MQPTTEILERISKDSLTHKEEVFTRLYRYLLRPDIYYQAYQRLYTNKGASTKGINQDTADGFSEAKIEKIIQSLADETYQPTPVRRTYIAKKSNPKKKRPLGIPTFTDKLVQEALRMILEAIYEPLFLDCSHGFRPKRSCHTALDKLKYQFGGVRWFVEGDIKGCFDNINHDALVGFIGSKVKDARIVKLVYKFLKAGYLEDWVYHKTYSGTPQGGILSPLLANIYLHELDKFVMQLKDEFDTPEKGKITPEYRELHNRIKNLCYHIDRKNGVERESMIAECKTLRKQLLKTPCTAQTDKKLKYIRYADDFIIGVKGSKEDCQWIKSKLSEFIGQTLKMELSEEKTLITHSSECARFLGFDVRVRRCEKVKRNKKGTKARTLNNHVELLEPLGATMAQECLSMLRRICKYAAHFHLIRPLEITVKLPQKSPKILLPFTTEEQKKLQSFVMDAPTPRKIGLLLGFQLGLRIGEICGLKWGDFDLLAGTVTIQRTVTRISCGNGHTKVVVQSPKTQNSHREIPLPKSLLRILKKLSKDFSSGTWFLSGNEEKPVEPRCYRKSIYGYLKKASVHQAHPHALRHTFATTCLQAHCDIKTLSELLGHADAAVTLKKYVHSDMTRKRKEINRVFENF